MKVTAFNGSPRGKESNTNVLVTAFLEGAAAAGAEVENIFLADKEIKHCKGCSTCLTSHGKCAIDDDMAGLLEKYVASEILVLATPLYIDNITGILKDFLDRTYAIGNPYLEVDANGEYRSGVSQHFKQGPPKLVVIANGGFPQRSNFQVISHHMHRLARSFHLDLVGEIYVPQGNLIGAGVKELAPIISGYKEYLHQAGQEVVISSKIFPETQQLLDSVFIPVEIYVREMNRFADLLADQK